MYMCVCLCIYIYLIYIDLLWCKIIYMGLCGSGNGWLFYNQHYGGYVLNGNGVDIY
jgi:hypothetical protein